MDWGKLVDILTLKTSSEGLYCSKVCWRLWLETQRTNSTNARKYFCYLIYIRRICMACGLCYKVGVHINAQWGRTGNQRGMKLTFEVDNHACAYMHALMKGTQQGSRFYASALVSRYQKSMLKHRWRQSVCIRCECGRNVIAVTPVVHVWRGGWFCVCWRKDGGSMSMCRWCVRGA